MKNALYHLSKNKTVNKVSSFYEFKTDKIYPKESDFIKSFFYTGNRDYHDRKEEHKDLYEILRRYNVILAGGFLSSIFSGSPINDIDIFFHDQDDFDGCIDELKQVHLDADQKADIKETKNVLSINLTSLEDGDYATNIASILNNNGLHLHRDFTYNNQKLNIQFIKPEVICGNVEDILDSFDFTCCAAAYHFRDEEFAFHPQFFYGISNKKLILTSKHSSNRLGSLTRVSKYIKKGYSISPTQLMLLALSINDQNDTIQDALDSLSNTSYEIGNFIQILKHSKHSKKQFDYNTLYDILEEHGVNFL